MTWSTSSTMSIGRLVSNNHSIGSSPGGGSSSHTQTTRTFTSGSPPPHRRSGAFSVTHAARTVTAAIDPATGEVKWLTTKHSVTAGCTISAADGRLYLGGYNQPRARIEDRFVWCLDARDGSLVWQSEPVVKAINVVTVGAKFIFAFAYGGNCYTIDKQTGKILSKFNHGYACTRFSLSGPYLLGSNADMIDLTDGARLVSTGPAFDLRECVGAVASNGRVFFATQANGLLVCQVCGDEAAALAPPWQASLDK
jgi:outer membrane protein assembly factor BamB